MDGTRGCGHGWTHRPGKKTCLLPFPLFTSHFQRWQATPSLYSPSVERVAVTSKVPLLGPELNLSKCFFPSCSLQRLSSKCLRTIIEAILSLTHTHKPTSSSRSQNQFGTIRHGRKNLSKALSSIATRKILHLLNINVGSFSYSPLV